MRVKSLFALHHDVESLSVRADQIADRLTLVLAATPNLRMATETGMVVVVAFGDDNFHKVHSIAGLTSEHNECRNHNNKESV